MEDIEKRQIETPKQALMFCMLLRKYIENSKIIKINQPSHERIVELFLKQQMTILKPKDLFWQLN
ncbi:MAG: NFACT family protein [Candidatus Melainabacteria bacterium]|nr:MAG: NFACT family protein [Candidatus Melainabacteria bacterium]